MTTSALCSNYQKLPVFAAFSLRGDVGIVPYIFYLFTFFNKLKAALLRCLLFLFCEYTGQKLGRIIPTPPPGFPVFL